MNKYNYWVIPASICVAFILTLLPLPDWARYLRPEWVSLVSIYWALAVPFRFGLGSAWVAGIFLDVATGTLLGQHALGLTLIVYIVLYIHQRLRLAPISQQGIIIFVLIFIEQTISLWINGIIEQKPSSLLLYYAPSLVSMLLWPWTLIILRAVRRSVQLK